MRYMVKDLNDENNWIMIGATGFVPPGGVPVPQNLWDEDSEWLDVVEVEDGSGGTRLEVQVDQVLKNSIQNERAAQQQAAQLRQTIKSSMGFGSQLMEDFIVENVSMGITQDDMSEAVLDVMAPVEAALRTGSLYVAMKRIKEIPADSKDDKYITDARLLEAVNKIEEYLGLPLSSSL